MSWRGWAAAPSRIGEIVECRRGEGYRVERRRAPLGVIAFVFEGRPNVFSDGAGVVKSGNAILVIAKDSAQDVRKVVDALAHGLAVTVAPQSTTLTTQQMQDIWSCPAGQSAPLSASAR